MDSECLCTNPAYVQNVLNCITNACTSQADINDTIKIANILCQALVRCPLPSPNQILN